MNFTKKVVTIIMLIGFICYLNAQQTPVFADYNYNPFIINAAYAGLTENTEVSISNSGFFNQFEGSPKTFSLSGHGAINRKKMGLGAGIIRDQIGVTNSTQFFAAYSYKIFFDLESNRPYWKLYDAGVISFGITAGLQQYQNNLAELGIVTDSKFSQNESASIPTVGLSFLFNYSSFYVGVSSPNILGNSFASDDSIKINSVYYGYFGYRFFNNQFQDLMIKPNVLLKYEEDAALQADINLAVSFKNRFEIGAGYRTSNSINFLAGIYLFNNLRILYNYNVTPANDNALGNTHGFILSYQFGNGYNN